MIGVSKTFGGSSILSSPALIKALETLSIFNVIELFYYQFIYELTDDGNLIEWDISELEKYDSQPDLYFLDNISKIVDDMGNNYYIVEDLIKDGASLSTNCYFSMNIESNRIKLEMLGYIENKEGTVRYYLKKNEVSEQTWMEWKNSIMRSRDISFELLWFNEISKENLQKSFDAIIVK